MVLDGGAQVALRPARLHRWSMVHAGARRRGAPGARRGAWVVSARRCGGGGSTVDVRGQRRAASQVVGACVGRVAWANRAMRAPLAGSALADWWVGVGF